jgi:hypothetical protein
MLDASLERVVVPFAYDDVHVAGVVVDQHLAQWCAVCSRRRLVGFPCPYGQEYCGLRRRKGPPFPCIHTRAVFPARQPAPRPRRPSDLRRIWL